MTRDITLPLTVETASLSGLVTPVNSTDPDGTLEQLEVIAAGRNEHLACLDLFGKLDVAGWPKDEDRHTRATWRILIVGGV